MEHFEIEYDNSTAVYSPGQPVSGKVIIRNQHCVNALSLKICIHGEAGTFWRKYEDKSKFDKDGHWYSYSEHINYTSKINYLKGESKPWTSLDGVNKIPAGLNVFPFVFHLPLNCPPSFENSHGFVRYSVHVELDRPWRFNADVKRPFSVIPQTDLNTIPLAINPMIGHACKHSGFFSSKEIKMKVTIPKRGYIPGESIRVLISVDNHAKKPLRSAAAELFQHVHLSAQRGNSHMFPNDHCDKHWEHKTGSSEVARVDKAVRVECCTQAQIVLDLPVPKVLVPSFKIPIIEVDYVIVVSVGDKLKCEFPCIIGGVPLRPIEEAPPDYSHVQMDRPPEYSEQPSAPPVEL